MSRSTWTREALVAKFKAPLIAQRQRRLAYFRSITPKVMPTDTDGMTLEELALLWSADYNPEGPVKLWSTLTRLARIFAGTGYVRAVHAERRRLLALLQRLINEGKVMRYRRSNTIHLLPAGVERLYALRGVVPPGPGEPLRRPAGPGIEDLLFSLSSFPIPATPVCPRVFTPGAVRHDAPGAAPAWPRDPALDFQFIDRPASRGRVVVV